MEASPSKQLPKAFFLRFLGIYSNIVIKRNFGKKKKHKGIF